MGRKLKNLLKWNEKELFQAIIGCLLFAIGMNIFIVPNSLYSGGVLGISQLLRSLIYYIANIHIDFDISGIINFALNIPLLILGYKLVSRTFFARTITCIIFQTLFLSIIPSPESLIVEETLTNVLIGGMVAGAGCGLIFTTHASGGGTDIIGIILSMRSRRLSIGKIGATINIIIFGICGIIYGLNTMIYSIIYSVIASIVIDHTHKQNIFSTVQIFTKKNPEQIITFIKEELARDATYWEAVGGYHNEKTYVIYSALSKYEVERLERHLKELDSHAFMIKTEGIGINGNFKKYLVD